jgi:raffinose/stachyose/melibiose transport system permease protein
MSSSVTTPIEAEDATRAVTVPRRRRRDSGDEGDTRRTNWWATALIAVCSLTVLIPLYLAVAVALKTPGQLAGGTGFELPWPINWENFAVAWERTAFPQALLNTALITVGSVVFTLLTSSLVAYALARNLHRPFFKGVFY